MKKFILLMLFCSLFTVSADAKIVPIDSSHFGLTSSKNFSAADDENLPVSYDLRNYGVVPPIRDQSPWGTCWAQAATASVETNYLKQIADGTINPVDSLGETSNDVTISAIHLSYYYVASPLRQQNFTAHDKTVTPNKIAKYPNAVNAFNNGGSVSHIITVWSRGYGWGPVADSEIPYHDFDNVTVNSKDVLEASPDVYTSALRLTEAEYFNSEISADLMFSDENRNVLKKLIMEKGAFSIAYNAVDDEKSFLNTTTGAYFYPLDAKSNANTDTPADKTNHLIAVIGWDDNFAVENFNSVARPSKPGAWLARNSWNTNWPSDELGGYFWISYEQILYHGTTFVIEPANKNLRTYYHDDLGWCSSWGDDDTTGKAAAVFQSKGNETIKEIGFYTTENGANVTVSIYKYDENPAVGRVIYDIQDGGALEAEQTEYYDLAGYHTMKLDSPVNISENEYFAAVLIAVNPS